MNDKEFEEFLSHFHNLRDEATPGGLFMHPSDSERLWKDIRSNASHFHSPGVPVITSEHIPEGEVLMVEPPRVITTLPEVELTYFYDVLDSPSLAIGSNYGIKIPRLMHQISVYWAEETAEGCLLEPWLVFTLLGVALVLLTLIIGL